MYGFWNVVEDVFEDLKNVKHGKDLLDHQNINAIQIYVYIIISI